MVLLIKRFLPYVLILGFIGMLGISLGMSGLSLIEQDSTTGLYYFNFYNYLSNIQIGFNNFKQNISNFYNVELRWDDFINCLKSIGNILIIMVNTNLLPLAIIGNVLNCLLSLIGLPMNGSNFLYAIFTGVGSMQIPYISY